MDCALKPETFAFHSCVFINIFSATVEGVHKEFQKTVRAGVCRYVPERGALLLISNDETSQRRATMIQDMHFRNLSQKVIDDCARLE